MALETPKSVRQIGECKGNRKIYIEDYVVSFAKQLAKRSDEKEVAGVLLGKSRVSKGEKYIFVSGMVAIERFAEREEQQFSQEIWGDIYTDIKENFTDLEILGWYYSKSEMPVACNEMLRGVHGKNFAGTDKILFIYDEAENEEGFFLSTAGVLEQQKGFYIYYEKNVEMREYMVGYQKAKKSFENVDDVAARHIRSVLQAKKGVSEGKPIPMIIKKKEGNYSVALGVLVAVFAILLGVVALQNQNIFNQVEGQLSNIKETFNQTSSEKSGEMEKTEVETLGANLATTGVAVAVSGQAADSKQDEKSEQATEPATSKPTPTLRPTSRPTPKETPVPTLTPTPAPTQKLEQKSVSKQMNAESEFWSYIVKKGDTLSQIAQRYYHTTRYAKKIKEVNGLKSEDHIKEGQKLRMPN